jgi:hypothetical protein
MRIYLAKLKLTQLPLNKIQIKYLRLLSSATLHILALKSSKILMAAAHGPGFSQLLIRLNRLKLQPAMKLGAWA